MNVGKVVHALVFLLQVCVALSAGYVRGTAKTERDLEVMAETRIIGGSQAQVGRYSYAVSIEDDMGHFCGGSLIAKDIVLTAAHCAIPTWRYNIIVGRHDLDTNLGDEVSVSDQIRHPSYSQATTNYDFNILVLDRSTTANVEVVKLNSDPSVPASGDDVTSMGWGDKNPSSITQLSDVLMNVEVNAISNQECQTSSGYIGGYYDTYNGRISSAMLCAQDTNQDSCQGDSGGPLVVLGNDPKGADDVQVGVVSWGIGCAHPEFPGVYSRVSSVYDWIRDHVCRRSSEPPAYLECEGSMPADRPGESAPASEPNNGVEAPDPVDDANCESFNLDIFTDGHASEISYTLEKIDGNSAEVVGSGPSTTLSGYTEYMPAANGCLPPGQYRFTIYDAYGDGIQDPGYYQISLDGVQLASNSNFGAEETTSFSVGSADVNPSLPAVSIESDWVDILVEDFTSGYGLFNSDGSEDVVYYPSVLNRQGVVRIQKGDTSEASVYSNKMIVNDSYAKLKVVFSFFANSMEYSDKFCLDFMLNESQEWKEGSCWQSYTHFENDVWYDDVIIEFDVVSIIETLRLRFRCDANSIHDDILIDQVKVLGLP